jgi:LysM repeat protein
MNSSASSRSARLLAPIALLASAAAVLAVVALSMGGDSSGDDPPQATADQAETTETDTTPRRNRLPRNYVIQPGDTLGGISEQTGVPIDTIEELNPEVDPQALIAGQRIKLRE